MKGLTFLLFFQLIVIATAAQTKKVFYITDYGAKPDAITNNANAIQRAIDEASRSGSGKVVIPRGRFLSGVIHLKSNVELNIREEAVLLASFDRYDYGPSRQASAFIVAEDQKNISITGKGLIDGQCDLLMNDIYVKLRSGQLFDDEWKSFNPWFQRRPGEANRPRIIEFRRCDKVALKGIRIQNSTGWVQNYKECRNVTVDSIHVFSNTFWNNDGIDLVDCKNAKVTNSFFNVADDGICLKSEDRNSYCENIYIANCRVRSSASAVKLGTASHGGFRNITIRNIEVYDTYRSAIAIEAVDGGFLENIDVRNIKAVNTGNAIFVRLGHRNKDDRFSTLKNVYIGDMKVQVPKGKPDKGYPMEGPDLKYPPMHKIDTAASYQSVSPWNNSGINSNAVAYPHNVFPSSITGLPGNYVKNVKIENVEIIYEGGADKNLNYFPLDSMEKITEAESSYPEFSMFGEVPVWGFYIRHADGLTMKNVKLVTIKPDFRTAMIFDDVRKLRIENVNIATAVKNHAVVVLNNVSDNELKNVHASGIKNPVLVR